MHLVDFRDDSVSITAVQQLLSYAVGLSSEERLNQLLHEVYSESDTSLIVLTDDTGEPAGIAGYRRVRGNIEIQHIAVDPGRRGHGLARLMLDYVRESERPIVLIAETDNEAVGFYRRYGFLIQSLGEKYPGVGRFLCRLE